MEEVSVRELRNYGGHVLDRVEAGEIMTITRDGKPVALISPLPAPRLNTSALLEQWRTVPPLDGDILRADITTWLDFDL
ncbi:MAG: type II toxin-antitoxin system prevent-host-death family antitoxin [Candidatus Nanopelagicales bacterium]|nr:type II toxin-antitoxin system prevent-host-death family antitoxin [Candidatus Nanopelagicales bacterium]MCF8539922.1 type II toxin-antitoxin system prevent-host-death family antitoxin [Candidatus Nanopelagicales bacterium]MCF8551765.1 type II toxin-antitoxin system prevent-host-death family antitoxin [Candidatus Nanopelagicales bacterium]